MHDRPARPTAFCWNQKYPRVCGEKSAVPLATPVRVGSPPRMRGKAGCTAADGNAEGITPAYAGKRRHTRMGQETGQDHPRVCGEKPSSCKVTSSVKGLPPRMRGKVTFVFLACKPMRITPAYAGKSPAVFPALPLAEDHPRVCGEKPNRILWEHWKEGSPPRMRGKVMEAYKASNPIRITPAYAGKSGTNTESEATGQDHPRVCGEKMEGVILNNDYLGSPPRMRGKEMHPWQCLQGHRITPAYAGKRHRKDFSQLIKKDHPRVCGEKCSCRHSASCPMGSPPRMRGKD